MSQENVELVRTTFETRRRGDPTPRAEYFDPEFEFHEDPRLTARSAVVLGPYLRSFSVASHSAVSGCSAAWSAPSPRCGVG
jgi:hypothetical protein